MAPVRVTRYRGTAYRRRPSRLIRLVCSCINWSALSMSFAFSCWLGVNARQVVPFRFSTWSTPSVSHQARNCSGEMPCFLKSWNTYSKDLSESQALAFLTVSQLGIPYRVIWGCFMGEIMPDLLPRRQSEVYAHHTPHIGRLAPS